jgi:hypothetical protein
MLEVDVLSVNMVTVIMYACALCSGMFLVLEMTFYVLICTIGFFLCVVMRDSIYRQLNGWS